MSPFSDLTMKQGISYHLISIFPKPTKDLEHNHIFRSFRIDSRISHPLD